ncbi:MAG: TonB family protein, partial [Acidobacteriota bacterium]
QEMIVGDVIFRAMVTEQGAVESVDILKVPRKNMGFEEAAEDAVMTWRFEPAIDGDKPIPSVYVGKVAFSLRPEDEEAIAELVKRGVAAWNSEELETIAHLFWSDAHFHGASGEYVKSQAENWFRDHISGSQLTVTVDMIQFTQNSATVELTFTIHRIGAGVLQEQITARMDKRDGTWRVTHANRSWDTDPVLVSKPPEPPYPPKARSSRVAGTVVIEILVRLDGSTDVLGVVKSLRYCDQVAKENAKLWRWKPALKKGKPIEAIGIITVEFSLLRRR